MMAAQEIVIDGFAGGGGASTGIELALGYSPHFAVNHDPEAIAMHWINHRSTRHFIQNINRIDPRDFIDGDDQVGMVWLSPDCKHFSKAKGARPVQRNIRELAWVAVHWARFVRPRVIFVENVEEFQTWGPISLDGKPIEDRKGETFKRWISTLRRMGYSVEWRELRACDYGAPTIRKRLYVIARCDKQPIIWPAATHGAAGDPAVLAGFKKPYRQAAEIIDWTQKAPSIFLTREEGRAENVNRPLVDNTMARLATGLNRYVTEDENPYIAPVTHAVGGRQALVSAFIAQHNTGVVGRAATEPLSTIVQRGTQQAIVAAYMLNLKGTHRRASAATEPLRVVGGDLHHAEVRAFLVKYYGTAVGQGMREPLHSVTTKHRFGLVTIHGEPWEIADVGMRMLSPRELFRAQSFGDSYVIDRGLFLNDNGQAEERPLSKTASVRMCGNSVCPVMAGALVAANYEPSRIRIAA